MNSRRALLSLGSNIEPHKHLDAAVAALRVGFGDISVSRYYRTAAVGFDGDDFLNAAASIHTGLDPMALNAWLHRLELEHGRRRDGPRFSARTLDIDIIYFDDLVLNGPDNLKIPRPEIQHAFVLGPLAEIAPEFVDPVQGKSLAQLWSVHPDFGTLGPA